MGYTLLIICALIIAIRIYKGQKDIKQEEQKKQPTAAEAYMSKKIDSLENNISTSSPNQSAIAHKEDDEYVLYTEDVYAGNTYAIFMKRDVLEEVKRGEDNWTFDDVILKKVRVTSNGTKHYLPMANREILYKIVKAWYEEPRTDENPVSYDLPAKSEETYVDEETVDYESETYYINNNSSSLSNIVGGLKIYDKDGDVVGKVSHNPLFNKYTLRNGLGEFIFSMSGDIHHKFSLYLSEDENEVVMEFAKQGNFDVGFGLGHFVVLPLLSLPFGSFYGVSRRGNIYLQKDGKSKIVYLDNAVIARITHKAGLAASVANTKSSVEMFTDDGELQAYVFAIFVCMHALN